MSIPVFKNEKRTVAVVPYDQAWINMYQDEAVQIAQVLKDIIVAIHHIGSTSITNMCSKPVIDILIEVRSITGADAYDEGMKGLGYLPKGEYGIKGRRFYLKGEINRTHHIHAFQAGDPEIKRHLLFRDYLIAHPHDAERYALLKKKLAEQHKHDIDGYCQGNDAFIREIDQKAQAWPKSRRWLD